MGFGKIEMFDSVKDGTKEIAEFTHEKTNAFHENYVSKVVPDCGKYGDTAKFAAEMVPGVAEYNAIKDGDWKAFAIAAGIDVAAVTAGFFTAGAGYAAVKGGGVAAKTGVKAATKEIAEAGTEKLLKGTVESGVEKVVKETTESGVQKATKELSEESTENTALKATKEVGDEMDKAHFNEYLDEVKEITGRDIKPNQLEKLQKALDEQNFSKLDPEDTEFRRKQFNNSKGILIETWEKNTGDKWPTYAQDVLNDKGEVIRCKGHRYDAHHLIEQSFGGPNEWWNLQPAATYEHRDIHKRLAKEIF